MLIAGSALFLLGTVLFVGTDAVQEVRSRGRGGSPGGAAAD
jgi:hypothetical protein